MNKLISVIIPVYNVEAYLERCVKSIINQTYSNLEIILIEDGSPDNCSQICDDLAKSDHRIKVIHQPNSGVSAARNAGLKIAKGDYIAFVDSDDYLNLNMYEYLVRALEDNDADMSLCQFKNVNDSDDVVLLSNTKADYDPCKVFKSKREVLLGLYKGGCRIGISLWNKLYKAELWENIFFPTELIRGEDETVMPVVLSRCNRIVVINNDLYNYYQRADSVMHSNNELIYLNQISVLFNRVKFFVDNNFLYCVPFAVKDYYRFTVSLVCKIILNKVHNININNVLKYNKEMCNLVKYKKYIICNSLIGCIIYKIYIYLKKYK